MAHRLLRDTEADGWERSDFPIICETCLGANPYVRMTKANFDKECKICTRPFTVFRWRPGRDARYKKTEVCQTCCKIKNVCQVCLLDLEYGLPVQVRDTALGIDTTDAIPKSDVNKEYFAEEHERKAKAGLDYESSYGKARPNDTILKLQRTTPYYKRNRAHICSFFVRGDCTRGAECPYRHEMPITGELAEQNIKDRYYGVNDPVAKKLLRRAAEMPSLEPPEDKSIRTLYVGGLDTRITEKDLKDQFYGYGELESIRVIPKSSCAFVAYTTREGAEKAAQNLVNKLVVKGLRLRLMWGRPQEPKDKKEENEAEGSQPGIAGGGGLSAPGASAGLVPRSLQQAQLGPSSSASEYPSMNPERLGTAPAMNPERLAPSSRPGPDAVATVSGGGPPLDASAPGAGPSLQPTYTGYPPSYQAAPAGAYPAPPSRQPYPGPQAYRGPLGYPPPGMGSPMGPGYFTPPPQAAAPFAGRPPPFPPMSAPPQLGPPPGPGPRMPPPHFGGPFHGGYGPPRGHSPGGYGPPRGPPQ